LTANVTEEHRQRALQVGMNDFVAKPIDIDHLIQVLERCLPARDASHAGDAGNDQPHDQVPARMELPGIDTVAALKVVRGKYRLLEKGLRMFLERFGEFENRFRLASSDVDGEAATREAHSLKGVAANLGMHGVREAAARLEAACLTEPEEIESRLGDVVESLRPVLDALKARFAA
jgi:two-component system, sensor histidine kinase and response regulator